MTLELHNVTKVYSGFKFGPVNLKIQNNTILVLIGPTGSGKTTLLNLISGLKKPDKGSIHIDRVDITYSPIHSRKIGYSFQHPSLFPHMTVYKNIIFGLDNKVKKNKESQIMQFINEFGISHLLDRKINGLSGGEMQKISLVRSLITKPKIMLMDEPLSHLDSLTKKRFRIELRRILKEQQMSCIYVTHFDEDVYALADVVAIIENGFITKSGTLTSILSNTQSNAAALLHSEHTFLQKYNYLEGRVIGLKNGVTVFRIGIHDFEIIGNYPLNSLVGILIKPEDIILSSKTVKTSARNIIKTKVIKISKPFLGTGLWNIHLSVDNIHLLSRITNESKNYLDIKEGNNIYAIFKATSPSIIRENHYTKNNNKNNNNSG